MERGPEAAAMAAQHLSLEWLPASREEGLPVAVSPQKKSCSEFLVH